MDYFKPPIAYECHSKYMYILGFWPKCTFGHTVWSWKCPWESIGSAAVAHIFPTSIGSTELCAKTGATTLGGSGIQGASTQHLKPRIGRESITGDRYKCCEKHWTLYVLSLTAKVDKSGISSKSLQPSGCPWESESCASRTNMSHYCPAACHWQILAARKFFP